MGAQNGDCHITTYSVAVSTGSPLVYFTDVLKAKKCTTSIMNKDS